MFFAVFCSLTWHNLKQCVLFIKIKLCVCLHTHKNFNFLKKLIVSWHWTLSYVAKSSGCWKTSHNALSTYSSLPPFHSRCVFTPLLSIINFYLLSNFVFYPICCISLLWFLFSLFFKAGPASDVFQIKGRLSSLPLLNACLTSIPYNI